MFPKMIFFLGGGICVPLYPSRGIPGSDLNRPHVPGFTNQCPGLYVFCYSHLGIFYTPFNIFLLLFILLPSVPVMRYSPPHICCGLEAREGAVARECVAVSLGLNTR